MIILTRGDDIILSLRASLAPDDFFDLTGATMATTIHSSPANVDFPNNSHTIDADQVANRGKCLLAVSQALSATFQPGESVKAVTTVTQGSRITHFHWRLKILSDIP